MNNRLGKLSSIALSTSAIWLLAFSASQAKAQNPQLQEKLQEIKQASAANKQALAHYTWQEQQTISLKGEVKKTQTFQVRIGPDGKQQKTELGASPAAAPPSGGRLKQHIVQKKKEEYQEYGQQLAELAKQYASPDPQALQQAYQQGNVSLQSGGGEGMINLVIKSYLKPNDSMTLTFNRQAKALQSVKVASYLSDPSDAVNITVQFDKLPSGVNHVATIQVDGVSKHLGVMIQNSNYQQL